MTSLRVLVVGNGAREHVIAKRLYDDGAEIVSAMAKKNPGIASISSQFEIININKPSDYRNFTNIDYAVIGPEDALANSVSDYLNEKGIPVVGPKKNLARLEWSKSYARELLTNYGIQGNPDYKVCHTLSDAREFLKKHKDVAVKPDVLTGGKGVKLTGEQLLTNEELLKYVEECINRDGLVVLEEKLKGKEFTLQAFVDGKNVEIMPMVRDYKRAYDGDKGPNTGSMGSFSCPNHLLPDIPNDAVKKGEDIMKKTITVLKNNVGEYKGILYGGFMNTMNGVYLIEYNVRFGDPEAINVLSLLDTPFTNICKQIIEGKLSKPRFKEEATVCVYVVPEGYPVNPKKDQSISIGDITASEIYYASVYDENGSIKTTTSRAVALLAKGESVEKARSRAYADINKITGSLFYRHDIAEGVK
ncbi:phosphoribosylamine--glycine ligase [Candidatus Bathyarchaeota archaeon]|nr:phosphoribosylamine--glycine ligase [Candidatus Bathyarchaeota archaeon]